MCTAGMCDKGLDSIIGKEFLQINNEKTNNPRHKMDKKLKWVLQKKEGRDDTPMKSCSAPSVSSETAVGVISRLASGL